jgi:hydrogenase nickel incorporation protein HypA/HybF
MHEVGLMSDALDIALAGAEKAGAERILGIKMRLGELSGVVPSALEFAFSSLSVGTIAEGASLQMEIIESGYKCGGCNKPLGTKYPKMACPWCSTHEFRRTGYEIEVASLEVE